MMTESIRGRERMNNGRLEGTEEDKGEMKRKDTVREESEEKIRSEM